MRNKIWSVFALVGCLAACTPAAPSARMGPTVQPTGTETALATRHGPTATTTATEPTQQLAITPDEALPTFREPPLALPPSLTVEEYALIDHPTNDPLTFIPISGSEDSVLARRSIGDQKPLYFSNRAALGASELVASVDWNQDSSEGWVSLKQDGEEIYRQAIGPASPILALRGLWVYDDHWVLETVSQTRRQEGNRVYFEDVTGQVILDGELLNSRYGYEEMFGFQLMAGKPFYFFKKDGKFGFSFDGQAVAAGYDLIPHYKCCSAGETNPRQAANMVAFFAQRKEVWYYIEVGVY